MTYAHTYPDTSLKGATLEILRGATNTGRKMKGELPTARQAEVWEAYHQYGGQAPAAKALHTSQGVVRSALLGYIRRAGISKLPPPGAREGIEFGQPDAVETKYGVSGLTKALQRRLKRPVSNAETVRALFDLQRLNLVDFRTASNPKRVRAGGGQPHADSSGTAIPISIKVTKRALEMDADSVAAVVRAQDERAEFDTARVAAEILTEGMEPKAPDPKWEPTHHYGITKKPVQSTIPPQAEGSPIHSEHHHPTREEVLAAPAPPQEEEPTEPGLVNPPLQPEEVTYPEWTSGPFVELSTLGATYPEIASLIGAEDRIREAGKLLRLAKQDTLAALTEEALEQRTPLEREVAAFIQDLVTRGLAR